MNREETVVADEFIDLGAVTEETHGGPVGQSLDLPQPKHVIGIVND